MAHTGGPTNMLPGYIAHLPVGTMCDNHPTVIAAARVIGETDSHGHEAHDLCAECFLEHKNAEPKEETCDLCENVEVLKPIRDPDEGSAGPVYQACAACRQRLIDYHADQNEPDLRDTDFGIGDSGFDELDNRDDNP